jgi:hypothetical protein
MYNPAKVNTQPEGKILDFEDVQEYVGRMIRSRAVRVLTPHIEFFKSKCIKEFFLAGGALYRAEVKDLDIWPCKGYEAVFNTLIPEKEDLLEVVNNGVKIQLCKAPVLGMVRELVDVFDYAHCQVGVRVTIKKDDTLDLCTYVSNNFIAAMASQTTFYCDMNEKQHGNPLRSLRRLPKVAIKLGLDDYEIMGISDSIVKDVQKRGITNMDIKPEGFDMQKDNIVTFEELYRLLQDRQRHITQKEEILAKIQSLTADLDKAKLALDSATGLIAVGEQKIKALGKELGNK